MKRLVFVFCSTLDLARNGRVPFAIRDDWPDCELTPSGYYVRDVEVMFR